MFNASGSGIMKKKDKKVAEMLNASGSGIMKKKDKKSHNHHKASSKENGKPRHMSKNPNSPSSNTHEHGENPRLPILKIYSNKKGFKSKFIERKEACLPQSVKPEVPIIRRPAKKEEEYIKYIQEDVALENDVIYGGIADSVKTKRRRCRDGEKNDDVIFSPVKMLSPRKRKKVTKAAGVKKIKVEATPVQDDFSDRLTSSSVSPSIPSYVIEFIKAELDRYDLLEHAEHLIEKHLGFESIASLLKPNPFRRISSALEEVLVSRCIEEAKSRLRHNSNDSNCSHDSGIGSKPTSPDGHPQLSPDSQLQSPDGHPQSSPDVQPQSPISHPPSPNSQSQSPVGPPQSSPNCQPQSPNEQSQSPVGHPQSSPDVQPQSPISRPPSPNGQSQSPVGLPQPSPNCQPQSPNEQTQSPVGHPQSSPDVQPQSPISRPPSPNGQSQSPVGLPQPSPNCQPQSPNEQTQSPVGHPQSSPDVQHQSPISHPPSPNGQSQSPVAPPQSSPNCQPQSPISHLQSPNGQSQSPVGHPQSSLDCQLQSPIGYPQSSPAVQPQSPIGHLQSPKGQLQSPVGNSQSPNDQPQSLVCHPQSSPDCQPQSSPNDQPQSLVCHPKSSPDCQPQSSPGDQPQYPNSQSQSPDSCPQSPNHQPQSPNGQLQSPNDQSQSPKGHPQSSNGQRESPNDHPLSPKGQLQYPKGQPQVSNGHLQSPDCQPLSPKEIITPYCNFHNYLDTAESCFNEEKCIEFKVVEIVEKESVDVKYLLVLRAPRPGTQNVSAQTKEHSKAKHERRVVHLGNLPCHFTKEHLMKIFHRFGKIEKIQIKSKHRTLDAKHKCLTSQTLIGSSSKRKSFQKECEMKCYGFITFEQFAVAQKVVANEKQLCTWPDGSISFGGRREFVKDEYADFDSEENNFNIGRSYTPNQDGDIDYTLLLRREQEKRGLIAPSQS